MSDTVFYTTAPKDYDWSQVAARKETNFVDHRGRRWSVVVMDERYGSVNAQLSRYGSGLHPAVPSEEFHKDWIGGGMVREAE